jgi:hypothetical protein
MNVRIEYPAEFMAAAYWDNSVMMNSYVVRCEMVTNTQDSREQNIALERLKYILFMQMQNSVFVDHREKAAIKRLQAAGMRTVIFPEQPVDQIIGMMLYSKLDSVIEGRMSVTQLKLASELGENITYFQTNTETVGPFAHKGWWNSPDPSVSDSKDEGKIVSIRGTTTWQLLGLDWDDSEQENNKGNTVVAFRKDEDQ